MTPNPFRPSFGVTPPLLAGRDTEILAFGDALDASPGAPDAPPCTPVSAASAKR